VTLVVDASAITELLLGRAAAERVELHLREHGFELHAPHLLDVEVLSALRRVVAAGAASAARAGEALDDLADLPIERWPHIALVARIWELRENFSPYDATYLALAETVGEAPVPVLTADARLARAAGAHTDIPVLLAD
jgi:predicted nucleic acid-binding protein